MGRRGYNQVCQIFLLRLKLDCKCCFNVFKKIIFFFLSLYFVTGRITITACASLLVKRSRTFHIAEEQTLALMKFNSVVALKKP